MRGTLMFRRVLKGLTVQERASLFFLATQIFVSRQSCYFYLPVAFALWQYASGAVSTYSSHMIFNHPLSRIKQ